MTSPRDSNQREHSQTAQAILPLLLWGAIRWGPEQHASEPTQRHIKLLSNFSNEKRGTRIPMNLRGGDSDPFSLSVCQMPTVRY